MNSKNTLKLGATLLLFTCSSVLMAGCPTNGQWINFTNTNSEVCIPLEENSLVTNRVDGNFDAKCKLQANSTICEGIEASNNTGPGAKINSLDATPRSVESGQAFTLSWSVRDADICRRYVTSSGQSISGVFSADEEYFKPNNGNESKNLSIFNNSTQDKDYVFHMNCYSLSAGVSKQTQPVTVRKATVASDCNINKASLPADERDLFQPNGFTQITKNFSQAFLSKERTVFYPDAAKEYPVEVPSRGKYLSIPITPKAGKKYIVVSVEAQRVSYSPIGSPTNGRLYMTISPCPGDFRLPKSSSFHPRVLADPSLSPACRVGPRAGPDFNYAVNVPSGTPFAGCKLTVNNPGQTTLYWNLIMADPRDGLTTSETECDNGVSSCHNNINHSEAQL